MEGYSKEEIVLLSTSRRKYQRFSQWQKALSNQLFDF